MHGDLAIIFLNIVLLSGAAALLSACNTAAGAAARAVTNSAEKVKSGL
jgi:predicted small secreted protein